MPQTCENPPAGGADGSGDCSLLGGVNTPDSKPATVKNQASSAGVALRCDFVAAALKRHRERSLLDVKRGSLWAVAAMARYHLDCVFGPSRSLNSMKSSRAPKLSSSTREP